MVNLLSAGDIEKDLNHIPFLIKNNA
jgi:hypothetical protein